MQLTVRHVTTYSYAQPARGIIQLLRATPASFAGQNVLDWRIDVDCDARLREGRDGYGNITHMLYVDKPVRGLSVSVTGRVLTEDRAGIVMGLPHDLPPQIFCRSTPLTAAGPAIQALARSIDGGPDPALGRLHNLNARLHQAMTFDTEATDPETSAEQAAAAGHGVCQDFAHMFIAAARLMGIPARYISGHLFRRDGVHAQEASHAWAEAWVGDLGWVAFDPTNGISADDAYVRIACGLDYRDAAPVAGARSGGGAEDLAVEVSVGETQQQAQHQSQS
jgi:transglutaminase-like putative cysteine protease